MFRPHSLLRLTDRSHLCNFHRRVAEVVLQSSRSATRTTLIRFIQTRSSLASSAFFHRTVATNNSLVSAHVASTSSSRFSLHSERTGCQIPSQSHRGSIVSHRNFSRILFALLWYRATKSAESRQIGTLPTNRKASNHSRIRSLP